jgi:prepilin-type N-terminal cleavage/methylation domain-containing protein
MKRLPLKNECGFTLIEIIAVLVILAIMAVGLSNLIIYGVRNFIFARDADQISQKAELALARIKQELVDITPDPSNPSANPISLASSTQVSYRSSSGNTYTLQISGNQVTLAKTNNPAIAAQTLIDGLAANNGGSTFLTYLLADGTTAWTTANTLNQLAQIRVVIVLSFQQTGQLTFQTTINPRGNTVLNAPSLN